MSSRDSILQKIRRHLPQATPLPDLTGDWIRYDDPAEQFRQVLEAVGGTLHIVNSTEDVVEMLGDRLQRGRVISAVKGIAEPLYQAGSVRDPHQLEDVELSILPGEWAVAENAAVWVQTPDLTLRTLYFISQYLVLVVPLAHVLNNLHEVYERIDPETSPFGCFIAGPSKTADIEQSLVKGAHGARTLTVFLVKDSPAQ